MTSRIPVESMSSFLRSESSSPKSRSSTRKFSQMNTRTAARLSLSIKRPSIRDNRYVRRNGDVPITRSLDESLDHQLGRQYSNEGHVVDLPHDTFLAQALLYEPLHQH